MTTPTGLPKLGRYPIVREIARSNDIVWEGYDSQMSRRVAVKELSLDPSLTGLAKRQRIERFFREARAAGTLNHPNIVTIHEVGEDNGRYFIAMEYLEGQTLRSRLDVAHALPVHDAIRIASELCDALQYAHSHGIIHRDIKPDNIHLIPGDRVKLTDFGIARITTESQLTVAGQVFGTPSYMSPEQVVGQDIDFRSDIFSLGIVLYEMITGRKPFTGESVVTITYRILNDPTPPLLGASPALDSVIRRATAKNPNERYASAAEFRAALHLAMEQRTRQTIMPGTMAVGAGGVPPLAAAGAGMPGAQATAQYGVQTQFAAAPPIPPVAAPAYSPPLPAPLQPPVSGSGGSNRIAGIALALLIGGGIAGGTGWMMTRAFQNAKMQSVANQGVATLNSAVTQYKQGQFEAAANMFRSIVASPTASAENRAAARKYEGYCYIQLGNQAKLANNLEQAKHWYEKAVEVSPADATAQKALKDLNGLIAMNRPPGSSDTTPTPGATPPASLPNTPQNPGTPPTQSEWFRRNQTGANEAAMLLQRGNEAFERGDFKQAGYYWSQTVSVGAGTQAAEEALRRLQQLQQ
jgi:serine/threonine-protein kinase